MSEIYRPRSGPIPKASRRRRNAGQRRPRQRDARHLGVVAKLPCLICGAKPVEAAHVRYADAARGKVEAGMGAKPDDKWTVPLCPHHHRLGPDAQHAMGERDFWSSHGVDPIEVCEELYAAWRQTEDLIEAEEIMINVIKRANRHAQRADRGG